MQVCRLAWFDRDEYLFCAEHRCFVDDDFGCPGAAEDESRARAIRAVVAAQWGVACSIGAWSYAAIDAREKARALRGEAYGDEDAARQRDIEDLADLPCAVDLIGDGT